jgi:hypothetical protein
MGLFSFVGGLLGAGSQKKASRKAEAAQLQYLQKAIDEESRQYNQSRTDLAPFRDIGTQALGPLGDLIGIGGADKQGAAISALQQSPLYQSLFNNGQEALLQNAAATGGLRGGNMQRGLADFGSDTLAKVIQSQIGNLGGLTTTGLGATNTTAGLGANTADAIAALFGKQGDARADGLLTRGGITASMWNNAGGFLDELGSAFIPGGGGIKAALGKMF